MLTMYCFPSSTSLPILLLSILFFLPSIISSPPPKSLSFSAPLIHRNFSAPLIHRNSSAPLIHRNFRHARHVSLNAYAAPVVPHVSFSGLYYMKYKIKVPPIESYCIPDTGSERIWLQPCTRCYRLLCTYTVCRSSEEYVHCVSSDTFCSGDVATDDSITLQGGIVKFASMVVLVRCGHNNKDFKESSPDLPPPGLISLNRANLSLVTLLSFKQFSHRISTTQDPASGHSLIKIGQGSTITGPDTHTQLKLNPHPTGWYFVNILGIRVGDERLDIPASVFEVNPQGTRGTGNNFFKLVRQAAFDSLVEEIKFQMQAVGLNPIENHDYELCYADVEFAPKIMILFEGLDFELSVANTWDQIAPSQFCLTILGRSDNLSVFGMIVMRDVKVGYDLANTVLSLSNNAFWDWPKRKAPFQNRPKRKAHKNRALGLENEASYSG